MGLAATSEMSAQIAAVTIDPPAPKVAVVRNMTSLPSMTDTVSVTA